MAVTSNRHYYSTFDTNTISLIHFSTDDIFLHLVILWL